MLQKGRIDEAIADFLKAIQIKPDYLEALNNLAFILATGSQALLRNGPQAVELAQHANQLAGGENPFILHTLAAAYAEAGRFGEAVASVQKAADLAHAAGRPDFAARLNGELKLYEAGLPLHEQGKPAGN